jgi:cytochrome c-type biogenesis protein CcmH
MNRLWIMVVLGALACASAHALPLEEPLPVAGQEARAQALFHEIRCVVCQGESIADSSADIAADMRRLIRGRVAMGDSNDAIKTYLASRYGDGILMQPPLTSSTALLWFGPLIILLVAMIIAFNYFCHPRLARGSRVASSANACGSRPPHEAGVTDHDNAL